MGLDLLLVRDVQLHLAHAADYNGRCQQSRGPGRSHAEVGTRNDSVPTFKDWKAIMGGYRNLLRLLLAWLLLSAMSASTVFANTTESRSQVYPLRITVLSAETHALNGGTPVPKDCDLSNYSAYCNESTNATAQSILLVQDAEGRSFRITCTTDS